ncbi:hypothetical protein B0H10DRAFT_2238043 [Mycena sp. CBHHK59/15]|nr:hypothetical protein B0H10DRAFT_2238043 [Mycena sp. CBHHK59/15]
MSYLIGAAAISWSDTSSSESQRTLDGNFQCNQFNKNTDPDDVSLCEGKGYFPLDSEYRQYMGRVPVSKEKSNCNYLKAVNKQDKKKFKNMAITGTVNCSGSVGEKTKDAGVSGKKRAADVEEGMAKKKKKTADDDDNYDFPKNAPAMPRPKAPSNPDPV